MTLHCTGQCNSYRLVKASSKGAINAVMPVKVRVNRYVGSLFVLGYKRCSLCEIYLDYFKRMCPCCNVHLAIMPRNKKGKCAIKKRFKRY